MFEAETCPFFVFFEIILESFYINLNLVIEITGDT